MIYFIKCLALCLAMIHKLGTCEASRFDSSSNRLFDSIRFDSDGPIRKFSNRPCQPIAYSSQTTQTINGA